MVIFESCPDYMPQISTLLLASGNGLLLKGGKEAVNLNAAIHKVIGDAILSGSNGAIKRDIMVQVSSCGQVGYKLLVMLFVFRFFLTVILFGRSLIC
jgi:gamma-glutamyl phosphate reductase